MSRFARLLLAAGVGCILLIYPAARPVHGAFTRPWLAGWPMAGHDPQRTYRSPAVGPTHPHLLFFRQNVDVSLVGPDGVMYGDVMSSGYSTPASMSPSGGTLTPFTSSVGLLALRPDGTLFGLTNGPDQLGAVGAFSPAGTLLWKHTRLGLKKGAMPLVSRGGVTFAPFIGHPYDGTSGLDVFSPSGAEQRINPAVATAGVALAPGGPLYELTVAAQSQTSWVQARTPAGALLWRRALPLDIESSWFCTCLSVSRDGTAYTVDGYNLLAYLHSGRLAWRFHTPDPFVALARRADGVIVAAGSHSLMAISARGALLWKTPASASLDFNLGSRLVVDARGTVYLSSPRGTVQVISARGRLLATLSAGGRHGAFSPSLLLGPDGRLIVNGTDGTLRVYR